MQGKVTAISKAGKYLEVEIDGNIYFYNTDKRKLLYNVRERDIFYAHEAKIQDKTIVAVTPPLISPDKNEVNHYLNKGKIKFNHDYNTLTHLSTILGTYNNQSHALAWWRKNIVQRSFYLIDVDMDSVKKIARLKGFDSLRGVYELILQNPLPYPFLKLEQCVYLSSFKGRKIPPFMYPLLRVSRKIYENLLNGHIYTPEKEIARLISNHDKCTEAFEEQNIVRDGNKYYYKEAFEAEKTLGRKVNKLLARDKHVYDLANVGDLSDDQIEALKLSLNEPIVCIEGHAGSGKSTLIIELVKKLPDAVVVSFTGKAVSHLRKITGTLCLTIHKLLVSDFVPSEIIVDEASMVSLPLMVALLRRCELKRLILIGDPFQLPPIEYGRPFERMLQCNIPKFSLSHVFRTKENAILDNTLNIRKGNLTSFITNENFVISGGGLDDVFNLVKSLQPKEVTIICPYTAPLNELNRGCQEIYHSGKNFYKDMFGNKYCLGDRVMCRENDYDRDIFNGEEGVVTSVDNNKIRVKFNSGIKDFSMTEGEEMSKIMCSYALSVHKSQGSEYDNVIFFLPNRSHSNFINSRMIYTALTRAKEKLFYFGDIQELLLASGRKIPFVYDNIIANLN